MNDTPPDQAMPSNDPERTTTVSEAGLTVAKSVERYRDDVVKIGFTIDSSADEALRLLVTDRLPEGVEADSVGFHPDFDPDGWSVDGGQTVTFESLVQPGERQETVYGVRVESGVEVDPFAGEPVLEVAAEAGGAGDHASPADDGMVFEPAATEEVAKAGRAADDTAAEATGKLEEVSVEYTSGDRAEADDAGGAGQEAEPVASEPTDDAPASDAAVADGDGDPSAPTVANGGGTAVRPDQRPDSEPPTSGPEGDGDPVGHLLDGLRRRELSADEQAALREALGLEPTPSESVRLDQVQVAVDDLFAYRDALEGFIDEHGPAEALVGEIRETFADHEAALEELDAAVDDLEARLDSLEAAQEAEAAAVEERLSTVESELSGDLASLDDELASVQDDLRRLREWREKLSVAAQLADTGVESDSPAD